MSKENSFTSQIVKFRDLTSPKAVRRTYHIAFSVDQKTQTYQPGDALGILPHNDPNLVQLLCKTLNANPLDSLLLNETSISLGEALTQKLDLQKVSLKLWKLFGQECHHSEKESYEQYHSDKLLRSQTIQDVLDLLQAFPKTTISAQKLVENLTTLKPRLYSICSAQQKHPTEVHIVIASVQTTHNDRLRLGACSSNTCAHLKIGDSLNIFFSPNKHFKPPTDNSPMIMIGPGTGVAPFRSFLELREILGHHKNWLFFGANSKEHSYLYQQELEDWEQKKVLKLTSVFSEKRQHPYYVQHAIEVAAKEVWDWIKNQKASIYICGDAEYMATDVQETLTKLIAEHGSMSLLEAQIYLKTLKKEKRFLLDIY